MDIDANELVHNAYNTIASDFDKTRFSLWIGVTNFLDTLPANTTLGDIGCGNGKYLPYRKDIVVQGCDICKPLVAITKAKYPDIDVIVANILSLPYLYKSFDNTISIAVMHHLTTVKDRKTFINELARITKDKVMISVWATEQDDKRLTKWTHIGNNDYIVPYMTSNNKKTVDRYYHLFEKQELIDLIGNIMTIERIWYHMNNWYIILQVV